MYRSSITGLRGMLLMLGLAAGPVLTMVDSSVVNVALAAITRSFGASLDTTQWIASGYLLAMAVVLPATAYLASRFGSMTTYLSCMLGFTVVSALCALAPSAEVLIGLRALQGAFGAPLTPLAIAMFLGGGNAVAVAGSPVVAGIIFFAAPALGPTVGGLLIAGAGWPWVFWINVPLGIAGIASVLRVGLDEPRDRCASFDGVGFMLLGLGAGLAVYGANEGPQVGWLDPRSLPYWLGGGVLVAAYVAWTTRCERPLLDVRLLYRRIAALATTVTAIASVVMYAVLILVPTFLQLAQGISPIVAGLVLLPQALATGLGLGIGARAAARRGMRATAAGGMLTLLAGTLILYVIRGDTPPAVIAALLCMRGFAVGFVEQPLLSGMLAGLSRAQTAEFSTLYDVTQRIAGAAGIGVFLTFFQARERADIGNALQRMGAPVSRSIATAIGGDSGAASLSSLPPGVHAAVATAASQALGETSLALLALALVGTALALVVPNRAGPATPVPARG